MGRTQSILTSKFTYMATLVREACSRFHSPPFLLKPSTKRMLSFVESFLECVEVLGVRAVCVGLQGWVRKWIGMRQNYFWGGSSRRASAWLVAKRRVELFAATDQLNCDGR